MILWRWLIALCLLVVCGAAVPTSQAQVITVAERGMPPIGSLISVSAPDEAGQVTITGAAGSVFPGAQVAVRNLYTAETVYTPASITGTFTATLFGPGNTPFLISPAPTIPSDVRGQPGALPGGPATIVRGSFPEGGTSTDRPITQLIVDGLLEDWQGYPTAAVGPGFVLQNQDSVYIGLEPSVVYDRLQIEINADGALLVLDVNPNGAEPATLRALTTPPRDLGTLAVAVAAGENAVELRIPATPVQNELLNPNAMLSVVQVAYLDAEGNSVDAQTFPDVAVPTVEEVDGIVYLGDELEGDVTRFSFSGTVAQGSSNWQVRGRTTRLDYAPGDAVRMQLDVRLSAPDLPPSLTGLAMIGQIHLLPVTDSSGEAVVGAVGASNGWSSVLTPTGFALENLRSEFTLGEVVIPPAQVIRRGDDLLFGFDVDLTVPADLPAATYVPVFQGLAQVGDGERTLWGENSVLGEGEQAYPPTPTRMPLVFNVGMEPDTPRRLPFALFYDDPSNGSRGILSVEDQQRLRLSNRVRYNSPTYILQPSTRYDGQTITYAIEPYIMNLLPNDYNTTAVPLLPLLFPSGRLTASIQFPDGSSDNLTAAPIVQSAISTQAFDERDRFGEQSQVDVYRFTTLNNTYINQTFDQYGDYTVTLEGFVEDVWGNRYVGGGNYTFLVAEQLDMQPFVLSGTPFEVGDFLHTGVHISPGVAADVTVTVRILPLEGAPTEQVITGTANAYGVFTPDSPIMLGAAGEYVVGYEARYTDEAGRLWAASLRSAGVIGAETSNMVLRGQRGLANAELSYEPARYIVERYTGDDASDAILYAPYIGGDVLWLADSPLNTMLPRLRLQDVSGRYAAWLRTTHPDYTAPDGTPIDRLAVEGALPAATLGDNADNDALVPFDADAISNGAYVYTNMVSPGKIMRQFVVGGEQGGLPLVWSLDDPLNQQIGAGYAGARPGDYAFVFGGAVVRNEAAGVNTTAIYAATAIVIEGDDDLGARVLPPFRDVTGNPAENALLTLADDDPVQMFFHPSGTQPGDVLHMGDPLDIVGQVAPTIPSQVNVAVTAPSGETRQVSGQTNAIGYFYAPSAGVMVDEPGVWQVNVAVRPDNGLASGLSDVLQPVGSVLGAPDNTFSVYVVPSQNDKFAWDQADGGDAAIPAGFPFNFTFAPPEGWTDVTPYLTVRLPQVVIEDGPAPLQGSVLPYQYNPTALNTAYPFFEGNDGRVDGAASSDPLTLTVAFTGTNPDGAPDIVARQFVIRHDRLLSLD